MGSVVPWNDAPTTSITVPGDAAPDDPQVFVGQGHPLIERLGQTAGIVFQWQNGRGFVLAVEDSGGTGDRGQLHLYGIDENRLRQYITVDFDNSTPGDDALTISVGSDTRFGVDPTGIYLGGSFDTSGAHLYGKHMGRGLVGSATAVASSPAIGAETAVLTTGAIVWKAGRAYRVEFIGATQGSAAGNFAYWRLRKTNLAGAQLVEMLRTRTETLPQNCELTAEIVNATGADITAPLCLTLQLSGGAGDVKMFAAPTVGPGRPATLRVTEINGDDTDYPNACPIT